MAHKPHRLAILSYHELHLLASLLHKKLRTLVRITGPIFPVCFQYFGVFFGSKLAQTMQFMMSQNGQTAQAIRMRLKNFV
jgi:hypothetical protein